MILDVEGVVFDLDATLVNLGGFVNWREGNKQVIEAYLECGCSEYLVRGYSEKGLFNMLQLMWDKLCKTYNRNDAERIQSMAYAVLEVFESQGISQCHLMPDCIETLEWLREQGIKIGVATSNSQKVAERILNSKGLRGFFTVVIGRTPKLRMKPYPDQILACFEILGADPSRGIVVGDSTSDVLAAKAAGAYVIAVPAYFTKRKALVKAGVDRIIESLGELPVVLSSLRTTKSANLSKRLHLITM